MGEVAGVVNVVRRVTGPRGVRVVMMGSHSRSCSSSFVRVVHIRVRQGVWTAVGVPQTRWYTIAGGTGRQAAVGVLVRMMWMVVVGITRSRHIGRDRVELEGICPFGGPIGARSHIMVHAVHFVCVLCALELQLDKVRDCVAECCGIFKSIPKRSKVVTNALAEHGRA